MGEGDRAPCEDLFLKQGHDAARATQHVAEADHRKAGAGLCLRQGLQDQFGQALGSAHDVGGPHRLVGRDQHEVLHAAFHCRRRQRERAKCVGQNAFCRIVLDDRHMLVSGRMVDGLDAVFAEYRFA
ncbi:hypothetical protein G6F57_021396 [Rhizopus arrhizus]|nr:hypothetical protein G6F24_017229 [Rhizopus arrhizus]KAG1434844.1 hypothetical protein G6F57_021396 [Rhizopus arrhizus]